MLYAQIAEFADSLSEIKSDLRGKYMNTCIKHLLKLYLFSDSQNKNHWRVEVYASFNKVAKLRGNNKYPKPELIFNTIWNHYSDILVNFVEDIFDEEPNEELTTTITGFEAENKLKQYIKWLSNQLGTKGSVTKSEVYSKLEEIGL